MISEHAIHTQCIVYFRLTWPEKIIYAIPNGGARDARVGALLKAEGVLSGVPDVCIPESSPDGKFHALYIEFKKPSKGKLSENQRKVINHLEQNGNRVEIVTNLSDFIKVTEDYLNPRPPKPS